MAEKQEDVFLKDDENAKNNKCPRTGELSECLKSYVKNLLNEVDDAKFISIYKACYKEFEKKDGITRPALSGSSIEARKYHSQFKGMIIRSTGRTIEETVLSMDDKLKELEELKLSQSDSNICWRPPGNVAEHMVPFEYITEMEKKKNLEGKIEQEQEILNAFKERLNKKRNRAKELNEKLLSLFEEIKNAVVTKVSED